MPDVADLADGFQDDQAQEGIRKARSTSSLPPCKACYNCDEPIGAGLLFCCTECREDFEKWLASRAREGR